MLTRFGVPFLIWMDEEVLPIAYDLLDSLADLAGAWRKVLDV